VGERFTLDEIKQMIQFADKDNDKKINYEEFVDIVKKEYPTI
jgi:Ca2+-binding EF-hand superfamily protein